VNPGWHRRLDLRGKIALLQEVSALQGNRCRKLIELGIPSSTYYRWRKRYQQEGGDGLAGKRRAPKRIWNRLSDDERKRVLTIAKHHPELSCRLLAIKITDEESFSVSATTVYRLLKQAGLVTPRPITDLPAAKSWRHKTKRPDEIWQSDATHYFVVDWGFYKQITVQDDYSRNPLAWDLKPDETAFSISDVVEQAIENAQQLGHLQDGLKPTLLSDNGPGFTSKVLAGYLDAHGIKHIFGKPYHPQTQGKIERFHRSIKEKICLLVYCSPEELKKGIDDAIMCYARTPHTALKNVSPLDVYMGRKEEILQRRQEKKRLTLERRKQYNMGYKKEGEQP
jgi:putative transposase